MHGNVSEWVYDWHANYTSGTQTNPEGPASGVKRVFRGGSWASVAGGSRSAGRWPKPTSFRGHLGYGFRIAFQKVLPDTANPELVLFGGAVITREAGQAWAEPGVEAYDARDGNITEQIVVTGTVDMNTTGTYSLNYAVQDAAGNSATATPTVTVTGTHTVDLNASVTMDMIWCPPGAFAMGSPANETGRGTNETQHNVLLTRGFYLGKHEVTQAQYEAVMTGVTGDRNATPSHWHGNPDRPVEKVSWEDAEVFLSRLNQQQAGSLPAGWSYVLPTEAQWEYACRAGTTTKYSWGNTISSTDANWDHGNDANQTQNVGSYNANPWGFFDMHGNVWERVADWYAENYPSGNRVIDPKGPLSGSRQVLRGGSLSSDSTHLRSAKRSTNTPNSRNSGVGFRVCFQKQ